MLEIVKKEYFDYFCSGKRCPRVSVRDFAYAQNAYPENIGYTKLSGLTHSTNFARRTIFDAFNRELADSRSFKLGALSV